MYSFKDPQIDLDFDDVDGDIDSQNTDPVEQNKNRRKQTLPSTKIKVEPNDSRVSSVSTPVDDKPMKVKQETVIDVRITNGDTVNGKKFDAKFPCILALLKSEPQE
ncbi:unnamed protein product [Owenia fusiformis]|uniref:Uncharacterized protein n=1 Tax=Owenia fusiformis TaxID=6347 RepID=A0A8S4NUH3_OWEFU|nr:unnamed protein product [Owenia fusiformis]